MNRVQYIKSILILAVSLLGCKSNADKFKCETPFKVAEDVKFIGHKGSGPIQKNQDDSWHENGRTSVVNALSKTDGTEIDIQMSEDSTLWLFHNHVIKTCKDTFVNFNSLSDNEINSINECNFNSQLLNLEKFLGLISRDTLVDKIVSLDLKVFSNPLVLEKWNVDTLLSYVFTKIDDFNVLENLKLEVPANIDLKTAQSLTNHKVYQVHYETVAITKEIENISIPFNLSSTYSNKNMQVWTPNKMSDLITALSSSPEIIQSDDITLISYFIDIRDGKSVECTSTKQIKIKESKQEFIELISDTTLPSEHSFYQLKNPQNKFLKDQYLVLSIKDERGEISFYEAVNLWEHPAYLFLNSSYSKKGSHTFSIYIWNKAKSPVNLQGKLIQYK